MDRFYEFLKARISPLPWAQIRIFIENRQKNPKLHKAFFFCATDSFIFVPLCCFTGETIQNLYSVCKNVSDELEDLFAFYQFLVWNLKTT